MDLIDVRDRAVTRPPGTGVSLLAAPELGVRQRAQAVATVAAQHADAVDRDARFPEAALAAARTQRLMSIMVPPELGGEGAGISEVADICYLLGRACASAAMIFAMHQIAVACVVRHARQSAWHVGLLRRLCDGQLLFASSTTDGQGGGDLRASVAALERTGSRIALVKSATVVSYGAEADVIVSTARRAPDAPPSDQVLVAFGRDDYTLERHLDWDALGMRGTCSAGFVLRASGDGDQVLPEPYRRIHAATMMPVANLAWSAVWTGVAAAAVERARAFVRNATRRSGGELPPGAAHLTRATASLRALRGMLAAAVHRYESIAADEQTLAGLDAQMAMNLLKVNASETAVATVTGAMRACGLSGYRNDGDFSIGRHLRDILSAPIMISNDRILANADSAALLIGAPDSLWD